jgi:CheY-like chemotaxis protein
MVVLVVEDDADSRAMIDQMLHLEGFVPVIAANGEEALLLLKAGLPAKAILLDLMMPTMDGWTFRRAQRNDAAISHIPVIIISAVAYLPQDELAASAVFSKPLDLDALVGELRRLCLNRPGSDE